MSKRRQHVPEVKATVALEALTGEATVSEPASRFGVHPTMIAPRRWEDQKAIRRTVFPTNALPGGASGVFERGGRKAPVIDEDQGRDPHARIGDRAIEAPSIPARW